MKKIKEALHSIKAFAPATCANVAVGFDILGFAIEDVGDYVTLTKREDKQIVIEAIDSSESLPLDSHKNTASAVIHKFCEELNLECGFSIHIKKGIPLCSGMGGSAASAVAALMACNAFLTDPLTVHELADFALFGEKIASGESHPDNIIPCLFGGFTLIHSQNPLQVIKLPIPNLYCVLLHPHLKVATREAREALKKEVSLTSHVQQSAHLAGFISALYQNDIALLKKSMQDIIIEPQRAKFVPEFCKIKEEALQAGAIGMSFSGSGPSLFALAKTRGDAERVSVAMQLPLHEQHIAADCWITKMSNNGAHVVEEIKCDM